MENEIKNIKHDLVWEAMITDLFAAIYSPPRENGFGFLCGHGMIEGSTVHTIVYFDAVKDATAG